MDVLKVAFRVGRPFELVEEVTDTINGVSVDLANHRRPVFMRMTGPVA